MPLTPADLTKAIEHEISLISQPELVDCIRRHLIQPRCEEREWDYGAPGRTYPSWIFAEDPASNTAFAFCEEGFGPAEPWGLLSLRGAHVSMGRDDAWFSQLEDAFRASMAWDGINPPRYEVS